MASSDTLVRGIEVDSQTRCAHFHSPIDIVAIRMKCCGVFYACKDCHQALAAHPIQRWPRGEWDQPAVLCGSCGANLTILEYLQCDSRCPRCAASFNPKCANHLHFYFEMPAP